MVESYDVLAVGTVQDIWLDGKLWCRELFCHSVQSTVGGMDCGGLGGASGGGDGDPLLQVGHCNFCEGICEGRCYRETVSGRLRPSSQGLSENTVTPERAHSFTPRAPGSTWPFPPCLLIFRPLCQPLNFIPVFLPGVWNQSRCCCIWSSLLSQLASGVLSRLDV